MVYSEIHTKSVDVLKQKHTKILRKNTEKHKKYAKRQRIRIDSVRKLRPNEI